MSELISLLEPLGELLVLARDDGGRRQALPRSPRRSSARRERRRAGRARASRAGRPVAGSSPFVRLSTGAVAGQRRRRPRRTPGSEPRARRGLPPSKGASSTWRARTPLQVDVRQVLAGCVPSPRSRAPGRDRGRRASRRARARASRLRKCRPPGARSDDDRRFTTRLTKSIATGTPSRSKRSRSWFSTQ